jgi:CBS domain-containing protein
MQLLKDLMSRDVKIIGPEMTIADAAMRMRDGGFGMLPVSENDRMIGTISDRDIAIRAIAEGKDARTKVRDVMSEGIAWAYEDDSVETAAKSARPVRCVRGQRTCCRFGPSMRRAPLLPTSIPTVSRLRSPLES